jgi:tRNA threonylcarbamoyladenosine biosynthesis protein TsaE
MKGKGVFDKAHFISHSPEETIKLGEELGRQLAPGTILSLEGTLGSGKTTLVKGIALALGIEDMITSPTFTIMSVYTGRLTLYHIDLYRLHGPEDLDSCGITDVLYGDGVSLVEWGEKALSELPPETRRIKLKINPDGSRTIDITTIKEGQA